MNEITSATNPLIKFFVSMQQKKNRQKERTFLIEGYKLINEALNSGIQISTVCYTEKFLDEMDEKFLTVFPKNFKIPDQLMDKISTTETPPQIIGVAEYINNDVIKPKKKTNLSILCDQLQDPGNFGTIIRLSEAMGVDELWMTFNSVDKYNPKVVRASAGSLFRVPIYETRDTEEFVMNLKSLDYNIVGATPHAKDLMYSIDFTKPTLLVIGQEGGGISDKIQKLLDIEFKIPMKGQIESLNAGVSTAIILGEAVRQKNYCQ